ncbi:MAG TPA: hypothetical protein VIJ12_00940 [Candidatus Baltobacteraceae bacterium]
MSTTLRRSLLTLAVLLLGSSAQGAATQRVTVRLVGCRDCAKNPPGLRVWDEGQDVQLMPPLVSGRSSSGFVLSVRPGYYRVFVRTKTCSGDTFFAVIPAHGRTANVPMRCWDPKKIVEIIRMVDASHALVGTLPPNVLAITARPAEGNGASIDGPISGTIADGAYYFDATNCTNCDVNLTLADGKSARIGIVLAHGDFTLTRYDVSERALRAGVALRGSPFNAPETLVQGPSKSIWILDRLGNRVAVIWPGHRVREYDLPTPFAGAGDIVGTSTAIWISENNVGKLVRIGWDGSLVEYPVAGAREPSLGIVLGGDGRIWSTNGEQVGAIDDRGRLTLYPGLPPSAWVDDLALGADNRIWAVGAARGNPDGFIAAVDTTGRWQHFPLSIAAVSILAGKKGFWVAGKFTGLSFVDLQGNEHPVALPITNMEAIPYAVDSGDTLWFSDQFGSIIAAVTPSGTVTATYAQTSIPTEIPDMRFDQSGRLWIAEPGTHSIEGYRRSLALPRGVNPEHLLFDSDGNLWYSDPVAAVVGAILKDGKSVCYAFRPRRIPKCAFQRADLVVP